MTMFPEVFVHATGEHLFPGTLNIKVGEAIAVEEHFRTRDPGDSEQDLLFEICRVGQIWAYRIRPRNRTTGHGGHGDHIIEIASSQKIPNAHHGAALEISFFRDSD
jgi:CTP-dependent riboflavin kinase